MVIKSVSSTELVILFRLAVCRFSTETYTSTLRCCSGRNMSKFGVHKMIRKATPTERFHFTCGQLQLLTSNKSPRNSGTLLMGCVKASGALDSNRTHQEATHDVVSWSKLRASSAKIAQNRSNISINTREPNTMSTSPMEKRLLPRICCSTGG